MASRHKCPLFTRRILARFPFRADNWFDFLQLTSRDFSCTLAASDNCHSTQRTPPILSFQYAIEFLCKTQSPETIIFAAEIRDLKIEVNSSKVSVQRQLELGRKLQELEDLRQAYPPASHEWCPYRCTLSASALLLAQQPNK